MYQRYTEYSDRFCGYCSGPDSLCPNEEKRLKGNKPKSISLKIPMFGWVKGDFNILLGNSLYFP